MSTDASASSYRDRSIELLNSWTSIRWGEENIAWVVHYHSSLVEPWIRAEAERKRLRPDQIESYRTSFADELRIDTTTPIMLSVQVFGATPLDLSPLGDNIWLIDSSGRRIRPMVIEKNMDGPFQGLVQNLIFFPKQQSDDFSIVVKGLVPDSETIFTFAGATHGAATIATDVASMEDENTIVPSEVVVKIPTAPKPPEPTAPPKNEEDEFGDEGETFEPTAPPVREPDPPVMPEPPMMPEGDIETAQAPAEIPMNFSPKQALEVYLRAWISGSTDTMYSMLSTGAQEKISKELFEREALGSSFRSLLKSGYKVTWTNDMTAKVTVARKILLMRSLESRTFRFIIEDGAARVER